MEELGESERVGEVDSASWSSSDIVCEGGSSVPAEGTKSSEKGANLVEQMELSKSSKSSESSRS